MVPIRIEDVLLACGLLSLLLRYLIYKDKSALNPLQRWMVIFLVVTGISFLFGLFVLNSVPGAKIGFLFWLRAPEYFATSYLCLLGVTKWQQYRQMMVVFGVFVSLIGVYGLLQEYSIVPIFNAMHMTDEIVVIQFSSGFGEDRLFSTFAGPYDLSAFYLLAIPIFTTLFVLAVSRVARLALSSRRTDPATIPASANRGIGPEGTGKMTKHRNNSHIDVGNDFGCGGSQRP